MKKQENQLLKSLKVDGRMIPLYNVYMPDKLPELNNILYSGMISYGKCGKEFEKEISNFIENDKFLVVNSYNSAMLVAIATIGLLPGDEVISSPMSCLASNQPFMTQNLKVVWADIDPFTGTLDPEDVKKRITSKTKAIFHNHHCGYIGYVDEINRIARENGLFIIDDAIEAFGSEYKGKKIGNLGADITVFSFQTVRLPNTIEGGGLSFNNSEFYKRAMLVRDYGIDRSRFRNELGEISKDCDITLPGFGATINEVNSYIGVMQMPQIFELLKIQRDNAANWKEKIFDDDDLETLKLVDGSLPNYWIFGTLTSNRLETVNKFRKRGYYASSVHLNNNLYSVFNSNLDLKGVREFYRNFVALPCGWWIKNIN